MLNAMKKIILFPFLLGALFAVVEARAQASSNFVDEVEAYVAQGCEQIEAQLAAEKNPAIRARLELHLRQTFGYDLEAYRKRILQSGKLTTPKVDELKAKREALIQEIEALNQTILKASEDAPAVRVLDQHRDANLEAISALREELSVMTPAQRRALEAKKASKNSNN